ARLNYGRQEEIFLDIETGKNAPLFRAKCNPRACYFIRLQSDQFEAGKAHRTSTLTNDTHDRFQRGRFPGAIAPQQRDNLSALHAEFHAVQDVRFTVPSVEIVDVE